MVLQHSNERSSARTFVVCPISVTFESRVTHGIVRDISAGGIFVYLNSRPALHTKIDFSLRLKDENISGTGEVIRIEESAPGAAIGVAIRISSYHNPPAAGVLT